MARVLLALVLLALIVGGVGVGMHRATATAEPPSWSLLAELPGPIRSVTRHGGRLLVAVRDHGLFAVDARTGEPAALFSSPGDDVMDVVPAAETVYLRIDRDDTRRSELYTLDADTGRSARRFTLGSDVADMPGLRDDGRIVLVESGLVRILDPDTRRTVDTVTVPGGLLHGGFMAEGRVYAARGYDGGVAVVDIASREPALLEVVDVEPWIETVAVAGSVAYVEGPKSGLGVVHLDSGAYAAFEARDVFVGGGGVAYALRADAIQRLDATGRAAATLPLPEALRAALGDGPAAISAVTPGAVLIASGARLYRLDSAGLQ